MNLKKRVTLAMVALIGLFVGMQGLIAYLSMEDQEDELADELVLTEARALAARAERGEFAGTRAALLAQPGPNFSAWLVDAAGSVVPGPLPPHLAKLTDGPHRPGRPAQHLHAVVLTTAAGRLFVQYDAEQNEERVEQFGWYMIALAALCVLLGALVARQIAGWIVGPIERLTARLANWAPGAVNHSAAGSDEEGRLLSAFERVQSRFEQGIAHEREFIANLSHELRTPLTALRTDLELLQQALPADQAQQSRLRRALAAVDAIAGSLSSARTLSQRQRGEREAVNLAACVDDAWASLATVDGVERLDFRNEVAKGSIVEADRHSLLTILRNLIRNAIEHAGPARCVVSLSARGVEVIDDGAGIAEADLPFIFDRYFRGRAADSGEADAGDNQGLGLAIARQVADLNGWRLHVEAAGSDDGGDRRGSRFILSFGGL